MSRLKIAQVMASGPVQGGLEKHFVELCNGLSERYEVLAIAHQAHGRGMCERVRFEPLDLTFSRISPLNFLHLHRVLSRYRPQVIHAHANKAASMIATLSRFYSARTVGTVHGFKRKNRCFAGFDAVIAVSPAIHSHIGLPQARVICNGIPLGDKPPHDPQLFVREFQLLELRPKVVAVGRLADVKGFAGLVQAWSGIEADLLIVGEGPERENLEQQIARLGLGDTVHLVGFRDDVPRIMAHADLVVMSSEREGFPYVLVEALHAEKVVVSTSFPGAAELLPDGFVVPYGEPDQLRAKIQATLVRLEDAREAYQSTWQYAREQFTVDSMVAQTAAVYEQFFRVAA